MKMRRGRVVRKNDAWTLYIHVTVHRNKLLFNNQPDAQIIPILFYYKTLHVSGIFSVHHQEFSTVHSAPISFKHVWWPLPSRVRMESSSIRTLLGSVLPHCRIVLSCSSNIPHTEHSLRCRTPDLQPTTILDNTPYCCKVESYASEDGQMIARNMLSWFKDQ
jgi:hypothetical protein